jgi:pimeloyl-ACP methyl ester carboxylesterase
MALVNPVIVIPGITASHLHDQYPLSPERVWGVLSKDYDRVALHPDNLKYEAQEPARVVPEQIFSVAYNELIEELRYNLKTREDRPVPVFPFAYDWRQPLDAIEEQLADFVDEVIERTKLLKHYHEEKYFENPKVNLVAHSMGGLVATGYLQARGKKSRVEKIATLATPFQGSFEAIIKVATGTANLGTSAPSSREREAARMTPALYHLLPSFKKGLVIDQGLPNSIFQPGLWQKGVTQTIKEYIRLRGLPDGKPGPRAAELFAKMLQVARKHRTRTDNFKLAEAGLTPSDWLCVVGVDADTRVGLKVTKANTEAQFVFNNDDRKNKWESDKEPERRQTGDGTVPFEGAVPKFLNINNLVCVSPDDFGYWELQDRALTKVAGFHGILPNMNMLHRMIVRHFTGRPDKHKNTWGAPAPNVNDWQTPFPLDQKSR